MHNIALIFAGGIGSRMGSQTPKQFLEWDGKTIIIHTLEVFENCAEIDSIVIACKEDWIEYTWSLIEKAGLKKIRAIVPGGDTALDSQYNGLLKIQELCQQENAVVLIHDGVRPLVDEATILRCIRGVQECGSAITVTNAIETVITIDKNGEITNVLDREYCRMAKAPQCFLLHDILRIHEKAIAEGKHDFIDSVSMMKAYGFQLNTVMGEPENIKITTPSDYYMFTGISRERKNEDRAT